MYCMEKLRAFGVKSDMLVTFYNYVICSLIMFGGGNISNFDRGKLEKDCEKSWPCCGKATGQF